MNKTKLFLITSLVATASLAGCGGSQATSTVTVPAGAPSAAVSATVRPVVPSSQSTASGPMTATAEGANGTTTPAPETTLAPPVVTGTVAATPGTSGGHDVVRFAMDWTPNTNHTGLYVAQQKGWYAAQGIDFQMLPYSEANTPDTLVGTGQADFGISFEESVVTDRVDKLPVKSVAAIIQTNTSALVTLKSSRLDSVAKLEGKQYAGFGSTYEEPVISTVLKAGGAKSGQFQNVTANLAGYQALVAKQADFLWVFMGWEVVQAKLDNVPLNTFLIKDYGVPDYYTPVIIANEQFLSQHPDVARRFLAATQQGYEYGVSNPDDAANLLVQGAPAGTFADPALPRQSQEYLAPDFKGRQAHWGLQTLDYWTNFPRFIASTGLLKTADGKVVKPEDIDYAGLFTNDYLPKP